jgi:lysophospholipid hydrolase
MTPNTGSPGTPNIHSDVSRVSRHLLGLDVGLVLGGGGARGAAHVGMLKAIQEAGIPIDRIGGVSIGAFIGGLWATHRDRSSLATLAKEWFLIIHNEWWNHIMDFTYPSTALFSGDFFNWSVKKVVGENIMIEDLWIPYFCCTTDISSQVFLTFVKHFL